MTAHPERDAETLLNQVLEGAVDSPSDRTWQQDEELILFGEERPRGLFNHIETVNENSVQEDDNTRDEDTLDDEGGLLGDGRSDAEDSNGGELASIGSAASLGKDGGCDAELDRLRNMIFLGPGQCRVNMQATNSLGQKFKAVCGGPRASCTRRGHLGQVETSRSGIGYYAVIPDGRPGRADGKRPELGIPMRAEDRESRISELDAERRRELDALEC